MIPALAYIIHSTRTPPQRLARRFSICAESPEASEEQQRSVTTGAKPKDTPPPCGTRTARLATGHHRVGSLEGRVVWREGGGRDVAVDAVVLDTGGIRLAEAGGSTQQGHGRRLT